MRKKSPSSPAIKAAVTADKADRTGKQVSYWMQSEDTKLIKDIMVWLMSQDKPASRNLVLRAALHTIKRNPEYVAMVEKLHAEDRNRIQTASRKAIIAKAQADMAAGK